MVNVTFLAHDDCSLLSAAPVTQPTPSAADLILCTAVTVDAVKLGNGDGGSEICSLGGVCDLAPLLTASAGDVVAG
ncbi:unnamed protein product [Parnassius apollo]|uniref:(apollo) hypothetical protein n=1 Tax=Parnassius apollo TaxID=110799 RepID=A0A8S3WS75_PARAO|nr:unnamed protein product [Parnassius apollo]